MPVPINRGSVLLLCLAVVSTLLLIAFAYVRVAALGHEASDGTSKALLAREAAQMGLNHAVEQIMRDYAHGPMTRMDDSAHAAFVSHYRPYDTYYSTDTEAPSVTNLNDLPAEAPLQEVPSHPYANGVYVWDGRGRFYEPEFYNQATVGYDPSATMATAPVKFGHNPWPAASALPDRSTGIWFDENMRRLSTGDARADRANARYRLRYAIGTMDLDAGLLITGDPGVDYRQVDAADPAHPGLGAEASRVVRAMHQLPQILYPLFLYGNTFNTFSWNAGVWAKDRVEHVFIGRGSASNCDIDLTTRAPVTFPLMYRSTAITEYANADSLYLLPGSAGGGTPIPSTDWLVRAHVGAPFSFTAFDEAIEGKKVGADRAYSRGWATPFGRGLALGASGRWSGPVETPWCVNVMTAPVAVVSGLVAGYMPPGAICRYMQELPPVGPPTASITDWVGGSKTITITGCRDLFVDKLSTAFSGFAAPARSAPAISPDYHGADTRQWHARYPGRLAYNGNPDNLPTGGVPRRNDNLGVFLRSEQRDASTGEGRIDETGRPDVTRRFWRFKEGKIIAPMHAQERNMAQFWIRNGDMGTGAFGDPNSSAWVATTAYVVGDRVKSGSATYRATAPNINMPPATNPAVWTREDWASDGSQTGKISAHPDSIWEVLGTAMSAAISMARGMYVQYPNVTFALPSSYFDGSAWSGPVPWAAAGRDITAWNPAWGAIPMVRGIRDVDALFVANLGSNWNEPRNPSPVRCWRSSGSAYRLESFLPTYNLASLRTATTSIEVVVTSNPLIPSITAAGAPVKVDIKAPQAPPSLYTFPIMSWNHANEPRRSQDASTAFAYTHPAYVDPDGNCPSYTATQRTAICELIINDMRLSLFGSSPGYRDDRGDGRYFFRALDLNGDGVAHCSGFNSTGIDVNLNLDRYTASVDANGVATVPVDTYFSNSGVFFVGKSRFWRICVRGEVWDNILNVTASSAQLETVLAVDPMNEAQEWQDPGTPGYAPDPAKGAYSSHVIYQRWLFNPNRAFLSRVQP